MRGLRPPFRLFELHSVIQIRSEVSAPARLCPREADAIGGAFVPADFLVRAGWGYERSDGGKAEDSVIYRCSRGAFIHDFHRRTSKAPAGAARTRLGN